MTDRMPLYGADLPDAIAKALGDLAARLEPTTTLAQHGLPVVVHQALQDRTLRPVERLAMYHLAHHLDFAEFRELKSATLASLMGIEDQTAGRALRALVAAGYLDEHGRRRPRAFRMPFSRRKSERRPAA